jgi:vacuolar-type H+-ATPase subunit C/Vma6
MFSYSACWGLLGALKDKGLKENILEEISPLSWRGSFSYLNQKYILEEYRPKSQEQIDLEHALNSTYLKHSSKFLRFLRGDAYNFTKLFLAEYDIYNIKFLARKFIFNIDMEEIRPYLYLDFPFSSFFNKKLDKINSLDSLEKILKKNIILSKILKQAREDYEKEKDISSFEISLDREYLKAVGDLAKQLEKNTCEAISKWLTLLAMMWTIRLKFIQGKTQEEIYHTISNLSLEFNREFFWKLMEKENIEQVLNFLKEDFGYKKIELEIDKEDYEQDFKKNFLYKLLRKPTFEFSSYPILFYLFKQKFLLEQIIQITMRKYNEVLV